MESELDKPRIVAAALSLAGMLVFGALLAFVLLSPRGFEQRAQSFIIGNVQEALGARTPMPTSPYKVAETLAEEVIAQQQKVLDALSDFVAASIEAMCRVECQDRAALEVVARKIFDDILSDWQLDAGMLRKFVEERYDAVMAELRHDIVIFLTCNLVVLTLAFLLALLRADAGTYLLPISALLTVSTLITSYWCVFGQNWFLTIVYADYAGWAYLVGLGIIFLLLVDIALNKARVTGEALDTMARMISF